MAGAVGPSELAIVLISAALHAGWSVAIKGSRDPVTFNLLQCLAASAGAALVLPLANASEVPAPVWRIVAATGAAHALYLYWLSRALESADISLVYPIARSTPALMPLAAIPLLGESVSGPGAAGIATVVAGIWLVSLGGRLELRALLRPGLLFAYLTLLSTVAYGLFDKAAMTHLEAATWTSPLPRPVFYFLGLYVTTTVFYVPLCLWRRGPSRIREVAAAEWWSVLAAFGIGLASYGLLLEALRTAPASYVVAVRQASVIFVLLFGVLGLGEQPGRARTVGACLTVVGVALIAVAP